MVMTQALMERLAGKEIVRELEAYLEQTFEDFSNVQSCYLSAVERLKNDLGGDSFPSVHDVVEAIDRQTASNLFFSGVLGIKANFDHFKDPVARTVLDVDFDVFLRENTARQLPEYEKAQAVIDRFWETLSPAQKEAFGGIIEYIAYLETMGPKLAHFYGYILGDEILYRVVPGYHPDEVLSMQYKSMLERCLGRSKLLVIGTQI